MVSGDRAVSASAHHLTFLKVAASPITFLPSGLGSELRGLTVTTEQLGAALRLGELSDDELLGVLSGAFPLSGLDTENQFRRKRRSTHLNAHKDRYGNQCYGRVGYFVRYG